MRAVIFARRLYSLISESTLRMQALLITKDLMFSSRVKGIARELDIELAIRGKTEGVSQAIAKDSLKIVVVDLETPDCDIEEWVKAATTGDDATRTKIVAYAPHGQVDRIKSARASGCDAVMTRGQFDRDASSILTEACLG